MKHLFSSDVDPIARRFIRANYSPRKIYTDITKRRHSAVARVHVYIAGFPCQNWSSVGLRNFFSDWRAAVFHGVRQYLEEKRPTIFLLENVVGLTTAKQGKCLKWVIDALEAIKGKSGRKYYNVYHKVLNTRNYGVPQNRPRIYIFGIKKTLDASNDFDIPERHDEPPPLRTIMDEEVGMMPEGSLPPASQTVARANLRKVVEEFAARGQDVSSMDVVVDIDASRDFCHYMENISPCLIRSRPYGFWVTSWGRRFTLKELWRLQGFDPSKIVATGSPRQMGQMIGNAMSVPVLVDILDVALRRLVHKPRCSRAEA